MPAHTSSGDITASIRCDLASSAQTGAPPLGHLAGLHRKPTDVGGYTLTLDPGRPLMAGGAGILEFAMLADLALGGAIRNRVGLALPMPTISMTLQLAPGRIREVEWADAERAVQLERTATARTRLHTADGEVIGDAVGVFALPRLPYDGPGRAMPWDIPLVEDANAPLRAVDDVDAASALGDESLVACIASHAAGTPDCAWGTRHVAEQLTAVTELALTPTPLMANRLGHIQGGALFTTAVLAAGQAGAFPVDALVTGTIEFIDGADLDDLLVPEVTILRAGGRSLIASVVLVQDGRVRCHVTTIFRR
ncbi:hypothetical protein GCM10010191_04550 [Actinomadura vinacea]|uniref:Uncharacterized protein n=1 Tax=Actinomadura vinacea TaxID=115336 RepID=A0ABP5VDU7_9ACTN